MCIKINQLDALQALVNGGVEQAVIMLNEILDFQIGLQVSSTELLSLQQASQTLEHRMGLVQVSAMRLPFTGRLGGNALLIFSIDSAAQLVAALMHEETDLPDLNAVKRGTLSEIGSIILNGVMAEISRTLKQSLQYAIPFYFEGTAKQLLSEAEPLEPEAGAMILLTHAHLTCDLLQFTGEIVLVFAVQSLDTLLLTLNL